MMKPRAGSITIAASPSFGAFRIHSPDNLVYPSACSERLASVRSKIYSLLITPFKGLPAPSTNLSASAPASEITPSKLTNASCLTCSLFAWALYSLNDIVCVTPSGLNKNNTALFTALGTTNEYTAIEIETNIPSKTR
jgi:hypothetical protein